MKKATCAWMLLGLVAAMAVAANAQDRELLACKKVANYNQCGGMSRAGAKDKAWSDVCCASTSKCVRQNQWYWQCTPASQAKPATPATPATPQGNKPASPIKPVRKPVNDEGPSNPVPAPQGNAKDAYATVLGLSYKFYEAQRSGKLTANNRIPWRADSFLNDMGPNGKTIWGGWFDAGDHVKFNLPGAWTLAMLAWGVLEFPQGYTASGQMATALANIRWAADFFIKCHISENVIVGQIGNGDVDHAIWNRPEDINIAYPVYTITPQAPGSDLAGAMSAALTATSLVFKKSDPAYSALCLSHARSIYKFGKTYIGKYSTSIPNAGAFYRSGSMWDDLAYAAAWLNIATGEASYKAEALAHMDKAIQTEPAQWNNFDWDSNYWGATMLMAKYWKNAAAIQRVQTFVAAWLKGQNGPVYTPKGLAWYTEWGALRHTSNAAFIVQVYAKSSLATGAQKKLFTCFSHKQMGYILGDTGRSFVVGYGANSPCQPHHRASSCPPLDEACDWNAFNSASCNPHTLYGALVGGPDANDVYTDSRKDFIRNEVTTDYNAGFTGVLAALIEAPIAKSACAAEGLNTFPTTKPLF